MSPACQSLQRFARNWRGPGRSSNLPIGLGFLDGLFGEECLFAFKGLDHALEGFDDGAAGCVDDPLEGLFDISLERLDLALKGEGVLAGLRLSQRSGVFEHPLCEGHRAGGGSRRFRSSPTPPSSLSRRMGLPLASQPLVWQR